MRCRSIDKFYSQIQAIKRASATTCIEHQCHQTARTIISSNIFPVSAQTIQQNVSGTIPVNNTQIIILRPRGHRTRYTENKSLRSIHHYIVGSGRLGIFKIRTAIIVNLERGYVGRNIRHNCVSISRHIDRKVT